MTMILKNLVVIAGAIAVSCGYLWVSPSLVPDQYALVVNFIAMPFVLGVLAGYLLVGGLSLKLAFLVLVPVAHVLLFGGDPGKPGLENILGFVEVVPLWVGCLTAHVLLRKKARPTPT